MSNNVTAQNFGKFCKERATFISSLLPAEIPGHQEIASNPDLAQRVMADLLSACYRRQIKGGTTPQGKFGSVYDFVRSNNVTKLWMAKQAKAAGRREEVNQETAFSVGLSILAHQAKLAKEQNLEEQRRHTL